MLKLRLGSSSATRARILKEAGVEFVQNGCNFDEESIESKSAKSFVYEVAKGKLDACIKKYGYSTPILVADTVVTADGKILRKAENEFRAREILAQQSGNSASIITCMIYKSQSIELVDISETLYRFDAFDKEALNLYISSGEWRGKAGACMVEGFCKPFIKEVHGTQNCAMGLSIEKLLPFLK